MTALFAIFLGVKNATTNQENRASAREKQASTDADSQCKLWTQRQW